MFLIAKRYKSLKILAWQVGHVRNSRNDWYFTHEGSLLKHEPNGVHLSTLCLQVVVPETFLIHSFQRR